MSSTAVVVQSPYKSRYTLAGEIDDDAVLSLPLEFDAFVIRHISDAPAGPRIDDRGMRVRPVQPPPAILI